MSYQDCPGQQIGNYQRIYTPEEAITVRLKHIDSQLEQFSEERRNALLSERARLLKAGKALGLKL
jgi:hypothetical protein